MLHLYWFLPFVSGVSGLIIVNPAAGRRIDVLKHFNITWIPEISDPRTISIDVISSDGVKGDVLYHIVQNYNTSTGQYQAAWPSTIRIPSPSCRLHISDYETDHFIKQSDTFSLTRKGLVPDTPPEPSDEIAKDVNPISDTTHEALIVETVVPSVVVFVVVCFGLNVWTRKIRRRRKIRGQKGKGKDEEEGEGEGKGEKNTQADIEEVRLVNTQDGTHDLDLENARPERSSKSIVTRPNPGRKSRIKWDLPAAPRLNSYSSLTDLSNSRPMLRLFPSSFSMGETSMSKSSNSRRSIVTNSLPASQPYSHLTSSINLLQPPSAPPPPPPLPASASGHQFPFPDFTGTSTSTSSRALTHNSFSTPTVIPPPALKSSATLIQTIPRLSRITTEAQQHHHHQQQQQQHTNQTEIESPISPVMARTSRDMTSPTTRSRLSALVHDLIHEELSRVGRQSHRRGSYDALAG